MAELNYDQNVPGGEIINIVHPHGPIYLRGESTRLRFAPGAWELSENWTIDQGQLVGCGPDSLSLSAPIEVLRNYSVCLFKDDPLSKGIFEVTLRIPGIVIGAAGLVVRFAAKSRPSGLAFILGGFGPKGFPAAALLFINQGEVKILQTAQLHNYRSDTRGVGIAVGFRSERIWALVQGQEVFNLAAHELDGAGAIGFIKFSSASAWFADPRFYLSPEPQSTPNHEEVEGRKGITEAIANMPSKSVPRVFISHSTQDKPFVRRLVEDLKRFDLKIWFDERELAIGDSIVSGISNGLKDTDYLVVVLSKSSVRSKWVQAELNAALINELSDKGTFILPALIEDCVLPSLLRDRKYADFRSDYDRGLTSLIEVFEEENKSAKMFIASGSPPSRGTTVMGATDNGGDCSSTLSALPLADLRRRIKDRMARTEIADVWFDVLDNEIMDDEMPGKSSSDCVRMLIDKARKRKLLPGLIISLCRNRIDIGNP